VKLFLSLLLFCLLSFNLSAKTTFFLRPHSAISNPLGIWAIPAGSKNNWSNTTLTIYQKESNLTVYLTYEFSPSDAPPPFTYAEYVAPVKNQYIEVKHKNKIIAQIENSTKKRKAADGQELMSGCGVYKPNGELLAYCVNNSNIAFDLRSINRTLLVSFFRESGNWKITSYDPEKIFDTVALILAGRRMWGKN